MTHQIKTEKGFYYQSRDEWVDDKENATVYYSLYELKSNAKKSKIKKYEIVSN